MEILAVGVPVYGVHVTKNDQYPLSSSISIAGRYSVSLLVLTLKLLGMMSSNHQPLVK